LVNKKQRYQKMPKKPTLLGKKLLCKTRLFRIESLDLKFSNGEERNYERLARGQNSTGAVIIVPMLNDHTVLLIREYSAGVDRYELGLPKGKIDLGESILDAANRELMEEVGYGARNLNHMTSLSIAPSYLEHMTDVVLARDLYEQKLPGDEPEPLEVVPWSMQELPALFASNECTEARSIAALFLTRDLLTQ
jgi:ADP-ribose diphosphatase